MVVIIIIIINIIVGSSCLIYGVNMLSNGLERINLQYIKKMLTRCTTNVISSLLIGTIITAIVQSSTAVTVITIGLVNTGVLGFSQAVGIIYGANIGTTITAQFMSFNIVDYFPVFILLGVILWLIGNTRKQPVKHLGKAIAGFGIMLLGIKILNWSIPYIQKSTVVKSLFVKYGKNPYLGMIIGTIATAIVHSSSATVGLTIVLYNAGLISSDAAIGLILGDNIGTCFTSILVSIGSSIPAKRTAWAHTLYNIIGSLLVLLFLTPFISIVNAFTSSLGQDSTRFVANAHTIFNILSALAFLPFTKQYVNLIKWLIN
ncbi:MAG TPA: Na/Pi cotransporter family protein [Clostridiaceae bacterium]|nr:Na/Pi cotransporter family protein [Clostridiaceae bacterium]